jgi:hypothetical protein
MYGQAVCMYALFFLGTVQFVGKDIPQFALFL